MKLDIDPKCAWRAWDHEDHEFYYFDTPDEMHSVMHGFFGDAWSYDVMRVIDREKEDKEYDENHAALKEVVEIAKEYCEEGSEISVEELDQRVGMAVYAGFLLGKGNYTMRAILDLFRDEPIRLKLEKKKSHLTLVIDNDKSSD